jgi:hypothetical protein
MMGGMHQFFHLQKVEKIALLKKHTTKSLISSTMEEHFRQIWIEKWIESLLHLLRQIDENGVREYFHCICSNKNLTPEYIDKHLADKIRKEKYYEYLSFNPNLTFDYVMKHIDENWDWGEISKCPDVTLDTVLKTRNNPKCEWNHRELAKNSNVTYKMLTTHPYFSGKHRIADWHGYCRNVNATFDELNKHVTGFKEYISYCPNLTLDDVFAHPEIPWNVTTLLKNPRIGKNVNNKDMRKLAEIYIRTTTDTFVNEACNYLQNYVTCLYETPEKVKKLGKKIQVLAYLCNPYLDISDLYEYVETMKSHKTFYISALLENDLAHNRDNFISSHISRVLLANMHEDRSRICHETEIEKVIADEWILNHVMKYV